MKTVYLKTTNKCNLTCHHCFVDHKKETSETLFEKTISFVKQIPDKTIRMVLHGGEPMLTGIDRLTAFTKRLNNEKEIDWGIQTNLAYPLTDAHIVFFKKTFNNLIGTSLDSTTRFSDPKIYTLWKENLGILRKNNIDISICFCLTKETIEAWTPNQLLDFCIEKDIYQLQLERATGEGQYIPSPENLDSFLFDLFNLYIEKIDSLKDRLTIPLFDSLLQNFESKPSYVFCRTCQQSIFTVNADETIGGCPNTADTEIWGNLSDGYQKIILSAMRKNSILKEKFHRDECLACEFFLECNGDCHQLKSCFGLKKIMKKIKENRKFYLEILWKIKKTADVNFTLKRQKNVI